MKSLSQFERVKKALEQVVSESDVTNGTNGLELIAHFWEHEMVSDKNRKDVETSIAKAVINGDLAAISELQKQLSAMPRAKINTVWRLLVPIPRIQGTKTLYDGNKSYQLSMDNVTTLYIPEDAIKLELLDYEETGDMAKDSNGKDTPIIKLIIKKGIIDIAAPITDRKGNVVRAKRAYVTPISYKAMQIAGRVINQEKIDKQKRFGFDESDNQ